ncbi:hypothetical protein ACX9NE_15385 [Mycobacterium sp. ML4]
MTEEVMPLLSNVRAMIENAERQGYIVRDDLSLSWKRPAGMNDATAEVYQRATEPFTQQIRAAAQSWWDAEERCPNRSPKTAAH